MAITDAQQAKQIMMKKGGKVAMQGGVKNYLGDQPEVQAPRKWQSGPDKPPTELAYITEAEKDLILKTDIHGSLSKGPNMGPSGIMSLDSFGDADGGGQAGGDVSDTAGSKDRGTGDYQVTDKKAQADYDRNRKAREKAAKEKAEKDRIQKEIDKYNKQQAKKTKSFKDKTMADLLAEEEDEKDDIKSGAIQDLFENEFKRVDRKRFTPPGLLGLGLKLLNPLLAKGSKYNREFFTDKVAPPGFDKMSLTQKNKAYSDYMGARQRGEVDAYGNEISNRGGGGGGGSQPIIPITQQTPKSQDDTEEEDFQLALAFRKDGGRVGLMEGGMPYEGGIMDLESGRQMYFLGKLVKKATRAVKKIVKSPIGKIGLGALAFKFGAPLLQGSSFMKNFGFNAIKDKIGGMGSGLGLSLAGGALAGLLQKGQEEEDEDGDGFDDNTGLDIKNLRDNYKVPMAFRAEGGMSDVESDPQYKGWKRIYEVNPDAAEMHPKHREFVKYYANVERQGKEEGGLMNLKGMEICLLYTSPSPRDRTRSRMPSSA